MALAIEIRTEGRRHYLIGNTYPIKDALRSVGAKWDPDRKAWWTGKREVAESVVARGAEQNPEREDPSGLDTKVIGRATHNGKSYYVIWSGETKRGYAAKLCFRDGSKVFWADGNSIQIVKSYAEPKTIRSLQEFAKRRQQEDAGERQCPVCARFCTCGTNQFCQHHHDGCDRCGEER